MALQNTVFASKEILWDTNYKKTIVFQQALGVGEDREASHPAVLWVTESQTRLYDWTELINITPFLVKIKGNPTGKTVEELRVGF